MNIKEVRRKIQAAIGEYEELLTNTKVVWLHLKAFLVKIFRQGTVKRWIDVWMNRSLAILRPF